MTLEDMHQLQLLMHVQNEYFAIALWSINVHTLSKPPVKLKVCVPNVARHWILCVPRVTSLVRFTCSTVKYIMFHY